MHQIENAQKVEISEDRDYFSNFSKIAFSEKLTTDFENRTKRQAETKTCVCFTWTVRLLIPTEQVLIVCIQTGSVRNGWKFDVAKWTELAL